MFKKDNIQVKLGDQFVELGKTSSTWEVVGIIDNPHLPPHARIKKIGGEGVHLTSVSALLDKAFYKPIEHKSVVTQEPQNDTYERIG
jgi:hypothetical protein